MASQNPRDMRDWIRIVERNQAQLHGIPALVHNAVEVVTDGLEQDKVRHPAAPVELTWQTAFYLDTSSRRRVRFLLDFPDVVFNTDGTPAQIQAYELWAREETVSALNLMTSAVPAQALPGATLPGLSHTASNAAIAAEAKPWTLRDTNISSFFRTDGFLPGTLWRFKARAIGSTATAGEFSADVLVQMLQDTTPPPMPTAPKVTAARGQLTVSWDGQAVSGAMPADFKYAILAHGTASSPTLEIARFGRVGGFKVVTDIGYYDPQFFRLAAVDESGNLGPWSEQGVGYTTPLVDKDIIISTIDGAKTYLKNIDARVSILDGTILTEHLVVTEEMTAKIANFLTVNADMINANSIWADAGFFGLADALLFRGDAFEGKSFTGGVFTGGRFQNTAEEYKGFKIDAAGIVGYSAAGGVETFRLDGATGDLTANSGTLTGLKYQTHTGVSTGVKIDAANGLRQWDGAGNLKVSIGGPSGANLVTGTLQTSPDGQAGVKIINSSQWGLPAILYSYQGDTGQEQAASFMRYSINLDPELVLRAPNRSMVGGTGLGFVRVEGELVMSLGPNSEQGIRSEGPTNFHAWSPTDGYHAMKVTGKLVDITAIDGNVRLLSGAQYVQAPGIYSKTTGVGANMYISEDGGMFRSISALKYKILPEVMDVPVSLLDVPMKDWIDLHSAEEYAALLDKPLPLSEQDARRLDAISLRRIPGAIAEDVEAAGGSQFVVYGKDGEVEGLMYERYALARTVLLHQRLNAALDRIEQLELRLGPP